jgi:Tol biopolymer transport system component/serine/threonine protein kinase
MTPERWQQIERLYHLAAAQKTSQRSTFLDEACRGDETMRQEIESLLAHEEPGSKFMQAPGMVVLAQAMAQQRAGSMIGQQLGAYRILSLLGAGGMGEVYQAQDTRLGRLVALKILPPGVAANPELRRRFLQEAKAASALNHPHIVTLYDVGSENGVDFLVMEYVPGSTLDKLIPRGGLALTTALRYAIDIADAFAKAHAAGIVHRDLKPGNVMVTDDGAVKVLDFGIAKLAEALESGTPAATALTKTATEGLILGTAAYMSPEQAEGKKVDGRSDIFSFGTLLYEMVTGRRAFQGDSKMSTLSAVLREEPKPASQVVEGLPREMERIIARCLRKSPERRFQTMADLKVAIEELKEESDSGKLSAAPASQRRRGRRPGWAISLPAIIAVAGGVLWLVHSAPKATEGALTAVPLTTYSGFQTEPSLSPDGNQVAFTWDGEKRDNSDIYVKVVGTAGPPLRLTTDPAVDHGPAWSPDGRFVAFVRSTEKKSEVRLIPALGGPERTLAEARSVWNLAWSPDSSSLVFSGRDSPGAPFVLFLLSIETGENRRLTSPPAQWLGDHSPAFSPDGRTLVFTRSIALQFGDLFQLAFPGAFEKSGEVRQMTFDKHATNAAWTPDGHKIVFSSAVEPMRSTGLWSMAVSSWTGPFPKPQQLVSLGQNLFGPTISHSRGRLAYVHRLVHASIWRTPVTGGRPPSASAIVKPPPGGAAFISSTRNEYEPRFSPDGKSIAFVSSRSGSPEIWLCQSDGSNAVQLTSVSGPDSPRWSPDGARIAFDSTVNGKLDIYTISASGGKPRRVTNDSSNNSNPSWSGDGLWIYFDSSRSGRQEVWKIPASGGPAIQITSDGGWVPIESPDRKYLYYFKDAEPTGSLWKMPLSGGQSSKVLDNVRDWNVALAKDGIYFARANNKSGGATIEFLSFSTNQVRSIATFDKPVGAGNGDLAVSPDGRWLLYTLLDQAGSELMLVDNFH